jgi:hypothetical protein
MKLRSLIGMGLVAISLVVVCEVETASAHQTGSAPVQVERRFVFTIRTINGYIKHVAIWAPRVSVAVNRLRDSHPHAQILAIN